jgi:hypothetical protein
MRATAKAAETEQPVQQTDKLYMENTLLRVAGALFCHDAKRAPTHNTPIELNKGVAEKSIIIRPDPEFGQPGPLAHKIFVALIKKHSGYGRPIQSDVSFTKRELIRLIGRSEWGGSASDQLTRALNEIHHTFIKTSFRSDKNKFVERSLNIFPEIYLERREQPTDPIEACTVTLARPIIASLEDGHFTCLNHALMQELGTIGQALFMRLFFHLSNLYDGHHTKRLSFTKRYDDICNEWLGGLTVLKYPSMIERDQLGPHLRELVSAKFLASYNIDRAKNGEGFVISFRPGSAFFDDYDRFYRRRERGSVQFDFHGDQRVIAEPLRVAYLFVEKRTGQKNAGIPYVPSKDVETAKQLLTQVTFEEMSAFIDYALAQAKKTRFDVQSLGGLRQYLSGYVEQRRQGTVHRAAHTTEQRATTQRMQYDRFRREQADRVFASLGAKERDAIETQARAKSPSRGHGPLAQTMFEIERSRITTQRHPNHIASFDQWKAQER